MKKLVLLLSVIVLLIVATGAVSAAKPAPDTFTITGYTTNDPFYRLETVWPQRAHAVSHVWPKAAENDDEDNAFCAL